MIPPQPIPHVRKCPKSKWPKAELRVLTYSVVDEARNDSQVTHKRDYYKFVEAKGGRTFQEISVRRKMFLFILNGDRDCRGMDIAYGQFECDA